MVRRMVPVQGRHHRPDGGARRWCAKMLVPLEQCQARQSATARMPGSTMEIYRHRGKAGEHDACRLGGERCPHCFHQQRDGGSDQQVCATLRWREADSNLYGAFPVKWFFSVYHQFFVRSGKRVLRPVACDQVPGARGRGQGTETLAKLGGLPPSGACVSQRPLFKPGAGFDA